MSSRSLNKYDLTINHKGGKYVFKNIKCIDLMRKVQEYFKSELGIDYTLNSKHVWDIANHRYKSKKSLLAHIISISKSQ